MYLVRPARPDCFSGSCVIGGFLVDRSFHRGWMNGTFKHISMLASALLAYWLAEVLGGNVWGTNIHSESCSPIVDVVQPTENRFCDDPASF